LGPEADIDRRPARGRLWATSGRGARKGPHAQKLWALLHSTLQVATTPTGRWAAVFWGL